MATDLSSDMVIVGGGIAGSALALVLARRGVGVTVLERQREYADRVRGEYMHPWGVAEAQRLGILDILLHAGGVFATRSIRYDEAVPPPVAEAGVRDIGAILPGVPGGLGVGHPAACHALSQAAEAAGARCWRGAGTVNVTPGPRPAVVFEVDGVRQLVRCRLVIGADGRDSTVRRQAGIPLRSTEPTHLFSGMLVGNVSAWPQDTAANGTEGDTQRQVFPQGSQRVRLYTSTAPDQRRRYGGPGGPARFLSDYRRMACMPLAGHLAEGTPLGPCATFGGEDTWVAVPVVEGVALIGDAAGYNDPIIGQGLSLALRDVWVLSELLLAEGSWTPERLLPYVEERRERLRRVRFTATLMAALFATFGAEGAARRERFIDRLGNPGFRGGALSASLGLGPDRSPDWAYTEEFWREVLE